MKFDNKTFWITGASSGMGRATAIALSEYNTRLIISDKDEEGLQQTAKQIVANGSTVRVEVLNMLDNKQIIDTANKVIADGEKVSGLYQFAGISQRSFTMDTPLDNDRKIMEINFFAVITLAKQLLPQMIKNGGGQFAVASSLVGKFGFPYRSAYSASKHALHGFFETILAEYFDQNIRVSVLIGGRINTNISKFALDKDGKEHGKTDPGQANGISTEKAAKQILRGLKKNKREILVGANELIILKIKRFFPSVHAKIVRKIKPM